jgi:hypothetical protein
MTTKAEKWASLERRCKERELRDDEHERQDTVVALIEASVAATLADPKIPLNFIEDPVPTDDDADYDELDDQTMDWYRANYSTFRSFKPFERIFYRVLSDAVDRAAEDRLNGISRTAVAGFLDNVCTVVRRGHWPKLDENDAVVDGDADMSEGGRGDGDYEQEQAELADELETEQGRSPEDAAERAKAFLQ